MKTIYLALAGAFALTGLLGFERKETSDLTTVPKVGEALRINYDTVPNKTLYRDLNTGETIDIWYDRVGMRTLNKKTGGPVEFYINTSTNDTVFGRGRFIVNNYVMKGDDGKWRLDEGKVVIDGEELKVKSGNQKFKIDGEKVKIKGNGDKAKPENGEIKAKNKDGSKE